MKRIMVPPIVIKLGGHEVEDPTFLAGFASVTGTWYKIGIYAG